MRRALVVLAVLIAAVAGCRSKDSPSRLTNGSVGVDSMGEGAYYSGHQAGYDQQKAAYNVEQPTK
jgi:hypothetical protein